MLQWYNIYTETLQKNEYVINSYCRFVSNKILETKQCTIVWYVDENKASHVKTKLIDELISYLKVRFGDLVITSGKKHSFMGMNI